MPRMQKNSEWSERTLGLLTDRGLVNKSLIDTEAFGHLISKYDSMIVSYLIGFVARHDGVTDRAAATERAIEIRDELLATMPSKLAKRWGKGGVSFRDLLLEGLHEAYYGWHKLSAVKKLFVVDQERREWLMAQRTELLDKTRRKLQAYQREHSKNGDLSFAIFRLWEDRAEKEALASLNAQLKSYEGLKPINQADFRKKLERARDLFGKFLFEEVELWIREKDEHGPEKYRKAFEELELMEDYAMKSKPCRVLLELVNEDE